MKKTLVTAVTLGACAATQLFAQNLKEGVITFSLTDFAQNSVSSSANALNQGGWNSPQTHYRTTQTAVNTKTILQAIGIVHGVYQRDASLILGMAASLLSCGSVTLLTIFFRVRRLRLAAGK